MADFRQQIAAQLMGQGFGPAPTVAQGMGNLGQALVGALLHKRGEAQKKVDMVLMGDALQKYADRDTAGALDIVKNIKNPDMATALMTKIITPTKPLGSLAKDRYDLERGDITQAEFDRKHNPMFQSSGFQADDARIIEQVNALHAAGKEIPGPLGRAYVASYQRTGAQRTIQTPRGIEMIEGVDMSPYVHPDELGYKIRSAGAEVAAKGKSPEVAAKEAALQMGLSAANEVASAIWDSPGNPNRTIILNMQYSTWGTEGRRLRTILEDALVAKTRAETGATMREEEIESTLARYLPSNKDNARTIETKMARLREFFQTSLEIINPELYKSLSTRGGGGTGGASVEDRERDWNIK